MNVSAASPARCELFGTQVHALGMDAALAWIRERIAWRAPAYVVTLNGALLVQAAQNPDMRALVNGAGLVTADGMGVILAARILGIRLPERVAGIDLMMGVIASASASGHGVYLLGGAPGDPQPGGGRRHGSPHPGGAARRTAGGVRRTPAGVVDAPVERGAGDPGLDRRRWIV